MEITLILNYKLGGMVNLAVLIFPIMNTEFFFTKTIFCLFLKQILGFKKYLSRSRMIA